MTAKKIRDGERRVFHTELSGKWRAVQEETNEEREKSLARLLDLIKHEKTFA